MFELSNEMIEALEAHHWDVKREITFDIITHNDGWFICDLPQVFADPVNVVENGWC